MDSQEKREQKETLKVGKKVEFNSKMFDFDSEKRMDKKFLIIGIILLLVAGIITGYFLAKEKKSQVLSTATGSGKIIRSEKVVGSLDEKAFPDSTEGVLEKGGIDGEGTHKLIREGGPDKTAYLTSSVINLNDYAGKKVKVWGQTFAAQKAGWLMDVGRLELLE